MENQMQLNAERMGLLKKLGRAVPEFMSAETSQFKALDIVYFDNSKNIVDNPWI